MQAREVTGVPQQLELQTHVLDEAAVENLW